MISPWSAEGSSEPMSENDIHNQVTDPSTATAVEPNDQRPVLEVAGLTVSFGDHRVVDEVNFDLHGGSRRGLIGESGSGKSLTGLALLGLLPRGARVSGSARFRGRELLDLTERERARLRGSSIAMVFQDAMSALNPLVPVVRQVREPLRRHRGLGKREATATVIELFERVRLADPERVARCCPPGLSGGQRQRVALAMALACEPAVLIADEPTTALDVTVQAEILALLAELVRGDTGPALLFVSHDLPVVAELCTDVMVMHDGTIVEHAAVTELVRSPAHPRTAELVEHALALESGLSGRDRERAS